MCSADSARAATQTCPPVEPRPDTSRAVEIAAIGWFALLGVLTLAPPSTSRMLTWPWVIGLALVWVGPVVVAGWKLARRARPALPRERTVTIGVLALAAGAVTSAAFSPYAAFSFVRVWPTVAGTAVFFLAHDWLASSDRAVRLAVLSRAVAILGALTLVSSLGSWIHAAWPTWPGGTRNAFPFGHSVYTAGFAVLLLPWFAVRFWQTQGAPRLGWAATMLIALATLVSTSSRTGAVVVAGMTAVAGVVAIGRARWSRSRKTLAVAAALIVAMAAIASNPRLRDLVLRRGWSDSAVESNRQRSAMLQAGLKLGAARPLWGWGPGSVPLAYPRVRAQLDGGVDNVLQLHSTPVQLWATGGAAALIAGVLLIVGVARSARLALRDPTCPPAAIAATASALAYGLFACTDHQLDVPIFATLLAIDTAILCASAGEPRVRPLAPAWRFAVLGAGAALLIMPGLTLGRDLLARRAYEHAIVAWEHGRGDQMLASLDRATAHAPHDPFFQHQAAGALLAASDQASASKRADLRRAAAARLEASLAAHVHEEFAHFNLGWLQLEFAAPREAARHFRAAAALVPDKGGVYFGLGLALQQLGAPGAVRAFALEWLNDPSSAFGPVWEIPSFATFRPAVQAEALQLYARLRTDYPPAAVAESWMRWWWRDPSVAAAPAGGFSQASAQFAAFWPAIATRQRIGASNDPWTALYEPWRTRATPSAYLAPARGDRALAAALARRAARHEGDFRDFLMAPTEDEAALLRTLRRQRVGYGVLAAHPDGPPLTDLYVVQENRVLATFAAPLFPAKGWVPGRFLLAMLPVEP